MFYMFSIYQTLVKYGVASTKNIWSNNKKDMEVVKILGPGDKINESIKKLYKLLKDELLNKKSILFDPLNLFTDTN